MAHDYSPDYCECCDRTSQAWGGINDIAKALGLRPDYHRHTRVEDIIEQIEDLQDLIKRQKYVLGQLSRGKR
jgi:hypothetical protein